MTRAGIAALRAPSLSAVAAARGLICKSALGKKLLLANAEHELISAIFAGENSIFQDDSEASE